MRSNQGVGTDDVRAVYDGVQARAYELFMGQQIHVGGLNATLDLADAAGIGPGQRGVELCCGSGASMRALVRLRDVASVVGIELADAPVERGRRAAEDQALHDRIRFIVGDATATDLPDAAADFVWGEDAWCYVPDKPALVREAARLTRPGGVLAFTDWVEGHAGLSDGEADHVLDLMRFPNLQSIDGYRSILEGAGCRVESAEDTGRFGPCFGLYADIVRTQLTFDVAELFDLDLDVVALVTEQLDGLSELGHDGKLVQARFVARKP